MTSNFIEMFIRKDEPIPPALARFLVIQINSELPSIRRTCIPLMTYVLNIIKDRSKLGDGRGYALKDVKSVIKTNDVDGGKWLADTIDPDSKMY